LAGFDHLGNALEIIVLGSAEKSGVIMADMTEHEPKLMNKFRLRLLAK
jgi:hypothetical protein